MKVALRNSVTKEVRLQKIGWIWTLLLLSPALGIPLFMRGLKGWGITSITLLIVVLSGPTFLPVITLVAGIIWLALKGNEITGNMLLQNGWEFDDPTGAEAQLAKRLWKTETIANTDKYKKVLTDAATIDIIKIVILCISVAIFILFRIYI